MLRPSMVSYIEKQIIENEAAGDLLDHLNFLFNVRSEMISNLEELDNMINDAINAVETLGVEF